MKKHYFKFLVLFIFFINSNVYVYAQCNPDFEICDDNTPPNPGDTGPADGTGGRTTPIDDYLPILVVTAIMIGGAISYKQRELFRK